MIGRAPWLASLALATGATVGMTTAKSREGALPSGWGGVAPPGFAIGPSTEHHGGAASVYLAGFGGTGFASLSQSLKATTYLGKRVRFAGWVKQDTIGARTQDSGLWLRVDGPTSTLAFDNMQSRPLVGTSDWHEVQIVLDVPPSAIGITVGALFNGTGTLHVDDLSLAVVPDTTPQTVASFTPLPNGRANAATVTAAYSSYGSTLVNPGLEQPQPIPPATTAWLSRALVPLTTTDPNAPLDDLAPFGKMVGAAHLVGLGEGTHGTREFFQMKHRMLEYLVSRLGFTYFAIEATSPEADDVNRYVLTGEGDPKRLLANLYFWTWNTQEVLDMVEWMRRWNATAPPAERVHFVGFDMQSPGASIDTVMSFIQRVDAPQRAFVGQRYACLDGYRNHGRQFARPSTSYTQLPETTRRACADGIAAVAMLIADSQSVYSRRTSASSAAHALHDARLVQQFEAMSAGGTAVRDSAMAENVVWLREQAGPAAKFVLWAHNAHINDVPLTMGGRLAARYGTDYVKLGFAFGRGEFNSAVPNQGLMKLRTDLVPNGSLEDAFVSTGRSLALLDTRTMPTAGSEAAPLVEPIAMRSIGSIYDPTQEQRYFSLVKFPRTFDLLMFVATPTASTLLPFTP